MVVLAILNFDDNRILFNYNGGFSKTKNDVISISPSKTTRRSNVDYWYKYCTKIIYIITNSTTVQRFL